MTLSPQVMNFLYATAKWGKFLAIVGFVMIGFLILLGIFGGSFMGAVMNSSMEANGGAANPLAGAMGAFFAVFYLLFAVLYFFPVLYLYKFSTRMQTGLRAKDEGLVESSFENLKSLFKFMGVLTAVILGFYGLIIVFGLGVAGVATMFN
ncbi:hypothetical protein TH61_07135 [Rufibacter sp. DG15C]|nr:hypothetical protein TH61_07135 [Rufibacter sp. DG15C]